MAVKLIVTPVRLAPRLTAPLLAVVDKLTVPDEAILVVVWRLLLLLTFSPEKVSPPEARLNVPAVVFTTVALPVVLSVNSGVDVFMLPILPEPDDIDSEVVPVTRPPVCVMEPVPVAVIASTAPETLPPRTMPELTPVLIKERLPVAVILLEVVIAAAALAESVKLILAPVEMPLPVVA